VSELSDLAIATARSQNSKLGNAATTYAAQTSCPASCPFFNGGGCYAEAGKVGFITARLNAAAAASVSGPREVAIAEADALDDLKVVRERPLRLHTVGDCSTDEAAEIVSGASGRYREREGGPVWTYTHAWRDVARESWGDVSVLASCETAADVDEARARGYATALVVESFETNKLHVIGPEGGAQAGADILPCPQQTRGKTCSECKLCFDDRGIHERGYSIAFELHGAPATLKRAKKALTDPDDPRRRLGTRELIPQVIEALEAEGVRVTDAAIAAEIGCNASSVAQMRKKLEAETTAR
jgi:hypothetical protein